MVPGKRWVIAIVMVSVGSFLLAIHDRLPEEDTIAAWSLGVGWLLVLGSAFAVAALGKRLWLYVPGSYIAAIVLAIAFFPLAYLVVDLSLLPGECRGWNAYAAEVNAYSATLYQRHDLVFGSERLTRDQLDSVIVDTEDDIERFRSLAPPPLAQPLNAQLLVVLEGWLAIYEDMQRGQFSWDQVEGLGSEEGELEQRTEEANAACRS